jgi:7-cyano-7-deazaguanine synthase
MKAIVSLSGGMDSATVLAWCLKEYDEVEAIGFTYGSKHNEFENKMAEKIASHYGVKFTLINLQEVMKNFKSNLLISGGDIPEGHYESDNMALTVVPGRNLIFSSILAGYAESTGADVIALGAHQGDHAIYPDCRKEFIESLTSTILLSSDTKVDVVAPFIRGNKISILKWGLENNVPYQLTRTCYKHQEISCGKCGSCQERLEAFELNNVKDPIPYE